MNVNCESRITNHESRITNHEPRITKRGLTLIELMMTIAMFAILVIVVAYVFRVALISWSSSETRAGIDITLDRAIEEMVRDLREAKLVRSTADYDEIRFTPDYTNYYIYYFYSSGDSYVPPPAFDQTTYELRRATLTGGIDGTLNTYGDGQVIIPDVLPPTTSDLSLNGNMITIDISVTRGDETIRSRTEARPRNL